MSKPCTLKHKKSIDNLREDLKEAGYTNNLAIGSDTSLRARKAHNEKIAEALPPIQAVINAWEKGLRQEGILREEESILEDKLVKPYPGDIDSRISFTRNILTVNIDESILKRLDDKRKSLGIYESKQSLSDYRKKQRENNKRDAQSLESLTNPTNNTVQDLSGNTYSVKESDIITYETEFGPIRYIINENGDMVMLSDKNTDTIKEGVSELFNENPELANIGTPEQYSQYLDTVFPDSKVKDIVYHGTGYFKGDKFTKDGYFTTLNTAEEYAKFNEDMIIEHAFGEGIPENEIKVDKKVIPAIVNIKNPKYLDKQNFREVEKNYPDNDGVISTNTVDPLGGTELQIKTSPEQIHILGSKQDIEQFKSWIDNNQSNVQSQDSQYSSGTNNENSLNSPIFEPQVKIVKLNCQ